MDQIIEQPPKWTNMVEVNEGILNLLEMVVRCYDCWLSCAAHITVVEPDGTERIIRKLEVDCG